MTRIKTGIFLPLSLLSLLILAIIGMIVIGFLFGRGITLLLVGIQALVLLVPLIKRITNNSLEIVEPGLWFSVIYFIHFGLRAVHDLVFGSKFLGLKSDSEQLEFLINYALIVSIVGLLAYWIGYHSRIAKKIANSVPELAPTWKIHFVLPFAILCFFMGWLIRVFIMFQTAGSVIGWIEANKDQILREVNGITYLLTISNVLIPFAYFTLFIIARNQKKLFHWILFSIFLVIELIFSLLSGSRSYIGFLVIQAIVAYYMTSDRGIRINRKLGILLGTISFTLLAMFPLLTSLRVFGLEGLKAENISSIASDVMSTVELIGNRFHGLDSLALIMERVPNHVEYSFGSEILLLLISWIPRALWSDKPVVSLGKLFREQMGLESLYGEGTSISITLPGQCYMSFGFIGVIAGMFLIGILWRFLHEYLVKPKNNLSNSLLVSVMFFSFFLSVEQTYNTLITYHFFRAFIVILMLLPLAKTSKLIKKDI